MTQKVYLLQYELASQNDSTDTLVFSTREKALAAFNEIYENEHEYAERNGWVEDLSEGCYEAYEDGYFSEAHSTITVFERELDKC